MTHTAAAAFLCMAYATTTEEAQDWLDIAEQRGATQAELQTAWVLWSTQHAADVQTIGGAA